MNYDNYLVDEKGKTHKIRFVGRGFGTTYRVWQADKRGQANSRISLLEAQAKFEVLYASNYYE